MRANLSLLLFLSTICILITLDYVLAFSIPQNPKPVSSEDDFCDSSNDLESKSAACSFDRVQQALFTCGNKGYPQQKLYLSRVGDGICDCCDGSDEAPGVCENTCEEEFRAMREKQAAEAKERADGMKARELLRKESTKAFWDLKAKADVAKVDREKYNTERSVVLEQIRLMEAQLEEEKQQQQVEFQQLLQSILADLSADEARNVLVALGKRGDAADVERLLDVIRPFYPEGVTADESAALFAVVGEENTDEEFEGIDDSDAAVAVEMDTTGEVVTDTENEPFKSFAEALQLSSIAESAFSEIISKFACETDLCRPLVNNVCQIAAGTKACEELSKIDCTSRNAVSEEVKALRQQHVELSNKYNGADVIVRDFEDAERKNWGEEDIWFSMREMCVDFDHNKYHYNICLFKKAKQDSTSLGTFSDVVTDKSTGKITFKYNNGDRCFVNQRARTLDVDVICGAETAILNVDEPETCAYVATLKSPVACV